MKTLARFAVALVGTVVEFVFGGAMVVVALVLWAATLDRQPEPAELIGAIFVIAGVAVVAPGLVARFRGRRPRTAKAFGQQLHSLVEAADEIPDLPIGYRAIVTSVKAIGRRLDRDGHIRRAVKTVREPGTVEASGSGVAN